MPATVNPIVITTFFLVRCAETDAMGVVHQAACLEYSEEGRSHSMRAVGSDYAQSEADDCQLPVTQVDLRYRQQVEIHTWIEANRSQHLDFACQVYLSPPKPCWYGILSGPTAGAGSAVVRPMAGAYSGHGDVNGHCTPRLNPA